MAEEVAAEARPRPLHHPDAGHRLRLPVRGRGAAAGWSSWPPGARPPASTSSAWAIPSCARTNQVRELTARVRAVVGEERRRCYHFHNTRNTGLANAFAAVLDGVTVLDASAGGIGGCPFAPTPPATSPPTTSSTCSTGWGSGPAWTSSALLPTAAFLTEQLGHQVPAMLPKAGPFP